MKRIITLLITSLSLTALCAAQDQDYTQVGIFRQEGIASFYGKEFAGRPTASGELFDPSQLTAAHPTLPFGTMLRITNKHNNKQVVVRVNDRGPFVSARFLDVSQGAAELLDMVSTGTAPILAESLGQVALGAPPQTAPAAPEAPPAAQIFQNSPQAQASPGGAAAPQGPPAQPPVSPVYQPQAQGASPPPAAAQAPAEILPGMPPLGTDKTYRVQVGSFKVPRHAAEVFEKLKNIGFSPAYERYDLNGVQHYRVVLSGVRPEEIQAVAERLGSAGFRDALVREER
ncbi:MAG: septal ring lytic transglycosylase RlpA family protein [Treponema sp.]|jgi:rare lipoprotein A|nr:septal ring lytic transglycosylase RlpA family protein [Treponema sp.]